MRPRKERLTVTVDRALVRAATEAVGEGRADSVSAWVSVAMQERAAKERRLVALAKAIGEYESRHGEITEQDLSDQARADARTAKVVRRRRPAPRRRGAA